ncbi:Zinc knuckle CX2CX4HX4C [Arabidopsis suecica]|uniref:Zinc knuckle CX2CX4HX4C n=1 Tax=Arabidopsis suecica TaxID=45249 RepID=A0A8T1ZHV6_ARASU|nr:Zinc knuckle CX2CX4HX4C [Arabidopsis suecica]
MTDKDLWLALQNLNLGAERSPLKLSSEATRKREADHRLSLVVKGLHPSQNPAGIKVLMPKIWKLEGKVTSRINEDGSVQFFFKHEHNLLTVLDNGPWTYKDWLVVVDRWTHRRYPDFLQTIRFWVRIFNIPDDSKEDRSIREIGGVLGHVEEVHIQQPTADLAGEVWVRVPIKVSARLIFARYFTLDDQPEPVLIRFYYDKLRKFCSACGGLTHLAADCTFQNPEPEHLQLPAPMIESQGEEQASSGNPIENNSHIPTAAADDAMGETVGSTINMDTSENQQHQDSQGELMDLLNPGDIPSRINETFAVREIASTSTPVQDRGTKRKATDADGEDEASTSRRRTQGFEEPPDNSLSQGYQPGGLAIFWKDAVKCDFLDTPTLYYTDMYISEGSTTFCLSYIYGNPERKPRQQLWGRMMALVQAGLYQSMPRLVLGDFNEIKSNDEKVGGARRPDWQFANFQRMINISGLHEIRTFGGQYTWIGNRSCGTIKSKLDRALATADWHEKYPKAHVQLLDWYGSDHRPLLLQTEDTKWRGKKLFRYDNRWRANSEVHQLVQKTWNQYCNDLPYQSFADVLKRCRNELSSWKTGQAQNSRKKIQQLQLALQKAYESSSPDYHYITNLKVQLQHEYHMEEEYWRTKSRIQWLHSGDKNTRYFHERTKQRRSHNRITSIQDDHGNIKTSDDDIQDIIHDYFERLYTSSGTSSTDSILQHLQPKVTPEINSKLLAPVTEEEIFQAISAMNVDKAPGPDGFNAGFYKFHWADIKAGVINYIQAFFDTGTLDPALNHTYICLVPKIESPTQVKDFRPISLCNVAYKIISKVLADRLKPWLHLLISESQSAFIPGRLITDNVIITHELLHSLSTKKTKIPYMALKLDIAKAFDKVEWHYVEAILKKLGFAEKWCQWVMTCISTVSYSVLINGSPTSKIHPQRGLRQGDPLSPYLYLLCTEGLSSLLHNAMLTKSIQGFKASRGGPPISHMLFADDSLLFCQASTAQCQQLLSILQEYAVASGQHVNFQKSAILFGKTVPSEIQQAITKLTGISKTGGFGRYLGLPEAVGRNKYNVFSYISQRVQSKIESWYSKFLSPAGKEVLIKSVATALPTYCMSCFLLPKKLLNQISGYIRRFWWSSLKEKHKLPWVAWNNMTKLKQHGGMGFRDLSKFNIALLAKQSWRILKEPKSLLSRVLKAKYFAKTSLMEAKLGHRPSHAWRSIHQGTQLLSQGLKWRIGDGRTVNIWSDPWLDNPPRPARCIADAPPSAVLKVSDLMLCGSYQWDEKKIQEIINSEDVKLIKRIHPRVMASPDSPNWIHTRNGQYTVKSGYHQLTKPSNTISADIQRSNQLCSSFWSLNIPPKIKHFWWRVLHNALPVADSLNRRRLRINPDCNFCGEGRETIQHLLFQCRVAKEIWELSPVNIDIGQFHGHHSLLDNIQALLHASGNKQSAEHLFPYLGWRIWKARNELLFNNKRWAIPNIIHQALADLRLWKEAHNLLTPNVQQSSKDKQPAPLTFQQVLTQTPSFCCCTDASWINQDSKSGIAWTLHDSMGRFILRGSASIEPTNNVLEAETIALKEAILQLRRLNYCNVTFCGDSISLYGYLEKNAHSGPHVIGPHEIQGLLQDITTLAHVSYRFKYINRQANQLADNLARNARICNSPYVVSWFP